MKVDSELLFCQSAQVQKLNSKTFEPNDNITDSAGLKGVKNIMKEPENGDLRELKCNKKDEDFRPFDGDGLWCSSEFDHLINRDDLRNANEHEIIEINESCDLSPKRIESWEKDLDFYADKGVMEYELPELIVCYKESTDHAVKDIWIDEGVPSHAKILFEGSIADDKVLHTFLAPSEGKNNVSLEENLDNTISTADALNFAPVTDFSKDSLDQCGFIVQMGAENTTVDDVLKPKFMAENLPFVQELSMGDSKAESFDNCNIDYARDVEDISEQKSLSKYISLVQELDLKDSHSEIFDNDGNGVDQECSQISSEEAVLASPTLVSSPAEASDDSREDLVPNPVCASDLCNNRKMESGSITFNFADSESAVSSCEESSQNLVSGQLGIKSTSKLEDLLSEEWAISNENQYTLSEVSFPAAGPSLGLIAESGDSGLLETRDMYKLEDGMFDNRSLLNQLQHDHGESSFSVPTSVSGLITYSGPIMYSGSVSLRSDSSTTSTRSFAFPVLQSEWNSSPVRMAKADRRQLRKHRGWRQGLLCCRF